jgi:uncharacterized membrane protein YeaQ/YmgE (transglycosylase-associated protein family)
MEILVWLAVGCAVGWLSYSRLGYNEARGVNVSMVLGAAGALIGAKAFAPLFATGPAGDASTLALVFAAATACGLLALTSLVYHRWGV